MLRFFRTMLVLGGAMLAACARTTPSTDPATERELTAATKTFLSAAARGDTANMRSVAADSLVRMYQAGGVVRPDMVQAAAATMKVDAVEAGRDRANVDFSYQMGGKPMNGRAVAVRKGNAWQLAVVSVLVEH